MCWGVRGRRARRARGARVAERIDKGEVAAGAAAQSRDEMAFPRAWAGCGWPGRSPRMPVRRAPPRHIRAATVAALLPCVALLALAVLAVATNANGRQHAEDINLAGKPEVDFAWPGQRGVVMKEQQENEGSVDEQPSLPTELQDLSEESLLHWALQHSDPGCSHHERKEGQPPPLDHGYRTLPLADELKKQAELLQSHVASEESLTIEERQQRVRDAIEAMKQPSDAELMGIAIKDITVRIPEQSPEVATILAQNATDAELERALEELLYLVEPIDNANDLHTLGGLVPLITLASHPSPGIRSKAAWVLGVSASNNLQFQTTLRTVAPQVLEARREASSDKPQPLRQSLRLSSLVGLGVR
eukprot:scaffold2765_cov328-Prasinococcus_capsulatus_cf.AAC.7